MIQFTTLGIVRNSVPVSRGTMVVRMSSVRGVPPA